MQWESHLKVNMYSVFALHGSHGVLVPGQHFPCCVWYINNQKVKRLKAFVWVLFMFPAITSMNINSFLYDYKGKTLQRAKVALGRFIAWCALAYLIIFAGSADAWEKKHAE
jgi:hypothetical protein